MFAADRVWPWVTTAGMVTPIGPSLPIESAKCSTISATTAATFFGVDFAGVGIRSRFPASSPVVRSTGAPLIPLPPMSIPRTGALRTGWSVIKGSLAIGIRSGAGWPSATSAGSAPELAQAPGVQPGIDLGAVGEVEPVEPAVDPEPARQVLTREVGAGEAGV